MFAVLAINSAKLNFERGVCRIGKAKLLSVLVVVMLFSSVFVFASAAAKEQSTASNLLSRADSFLFGTGGRSTTVTGYQVSEGGGGSASATIACTDSDNGEDYNSKGITTGLDLPVSSVVSREDSCDSGIIIREYYCYKGSPSYPDGYIVSSAMACQSGTNCSNGACVASASSGSGGGGGAKLSPCGSYGDVNGDGFVSSADSAAINKHVVGSSELSNSQFKLADVNADGSVSVKDSIYIERYLAGMITTFPVCQSSSGGGGGGSTGCARKNPALTMSPVSQEVVAGETATFKVAIANNDNAACGPSVFQRYSDSWSNTPGDVVVTDDFTGKDLPPVSPQSSFSYSLYAKVSEKAMLGDYEINVEVRNQTPASSQPSQIYSDKETVLLIVKPKQQACSDSDGGLDYHVKGTARQGDNYFEDSCITGTAILNEAYCKDNIVTIPPGYTCQYGCKDGACLQSGGGSIGVPDVSVDWITIAPGSYPHYVGNDLVAMVTIRNIGTATVECAKYCAEGEKSFPVTFSVSGLLPAVMKYSDETGAVKNGWNDAGVMKLTVTIPPMKAGGSRSFSITLRFSEAGNYRFVASAGNAPGPAGSFTNEDDLHLSNNWKEKSSEVLPKKTAEKPSCTDSDMGQNLHTKGIVKYNQNFEEKYRHELVDSCSGSTLNEYYCDANGNAQTAYFSCPYSCSDGACLKQPIKETKNGFIGTSWECYDGSSGATASSGGSVCYAEEGLRSRAEEACENRCSLSSGKCGVNSFSVSGDCEISAAPVVPPELEPPEVPDDRRVYEVHIKKGWNIVGLLPLMAVSENVGKSSSTCLWSQAGKVTDYLKKNVFGFDALKKSYVPLGDLSTSTPPEGSYLSNTPLNGYWLRSSEDCSITMDFSQMAPDNEIFNVIEKRVSQYNWKLAKGWNFFTVLPEMEGKTLDDMRGSCEVKSAYGYDSFSNRWVNLNRIEFSHEAVGYGFVMKVADECVLGSSAALPPPLPEEESSASSGGGGGRGIAATASASGGGGASSVSSAASSKEGG